MQSAEIEQLENVKAAVEKALRKMAPAMPGHCPHCHAALDTEYRSLRVKGQLRALLADFWPLAERYARAWKKCCDEAPEEPEEANDAAWKAFDDAHVELLNEIGALLIQIEWLWIGYTDGDPIWDVSEFAADVYLESIIVNCAMYRAYHGPGVGP